MYRRLALFCLAILAPGCTGDSGDEDEFVEDLTQMPADEGKADGPTYVQDYLSRGCTTAPVLPLAQQVAERVACSGPRQTERFEESASIRFVGSAILPYLDPDAVADLRAAAQEQGVIEINSGYRTLPQQYLLYHWLNRRCGITAAALPGRSNHETGRALDIRNYGAARRALGRHGWKGDVPKDPVHYDHIASPDGRGLDVIAFQELWNLNHPGDPIDTDGDFGPETERRLAMSPAKGFAMSGCSN